MENIDEILEKLKQNFTSIKETQTEEEKKEEIKNNYPIVYKLHCEYQEILEWAFGEAAYENIQKEDLNRLWKEQHPEAPDLLIPEINAVFDLTTTYIFIQILKYKFGIK